jgi:FMN phosphatase YigB (HAD superfamily)
MRTAVRAADIASLLDDAPADIRCLSLDCFDTLLWRNTQAPKDVFAELPVRGGGIEPRVSAESRARAERMAAENLSEVTIDAIYQRLMPGADPADRAEAIECELRAEARHCYAFAPTVALMRAAKARGLRVVIVSDTYLSAEQLRALIARSAGEDVTALIDQIFVSSEHGVAKADGLFRPVLAALALPPFAILHLGDNPVADAQAPRALGIRAVLFEQFDAVTEQRLRLEAAAAAMISPATRVTLPAVQPHRPQLSLRSGAASVDRLGHDVLGPVMDAFARWVRAEADALDGAASRPAKILFLLRDGHLPHRAFEAAGLGDAAAIEISRFTALAASFRDVESIRTFLVTETTSEISILARQLLLNAGEARQIGRTSAEFRKQVLAPANVKRIVARSQAFAKRLGAHVRRAGVEPGDTVMLVDLGYNGSVQNAVEATLQEQLDVRVAGRYLLLRERWPSGLDKKGLLDVRHYDTRLVDALCGPIAVLEQLCTAAQGSVVDYHPDGKPIRKSPGVKGAQSATRDAVQAACLDFVATTRDAVHRRPASDDDDCRRQLAGAVLARLLYLPLPEEIALLERFDHDINLGTQETIKLIDAEVSGTQLRRRGLPYISAADRMYLPGEVQRHGLPLALSLLTTGCMGLDLRHSDFQVGAIDVPVLLAGSGGQTLISTPAHPTHDGYYLATVPAGTGEYAIGVQLGAIAEMVQIDEVAFYPVQTFSEFGTKPAAAVAPLLDAMEQVAPGLHRCAAEGLIFVPPPAVAGRQPLLLAVTFRPVIRRQESLAGSVSKAA